MGDPKRGRGRQNSALTTATSLSGWLSSLTKRYTGDPGLCHSPRCLPGEFSGHAKRPKPCLPWFRCGAALTMTLTMGSPRNCRACSARWGGSQWMPAARAYPHGMAIGLPLLRIGGWHDHCALSPILNRARQRWPCSMATTRAYRHSEEDARHEATQDPHPIG